jgi:hypothetical protein
VGLAGQHTLGLWTQGRHTRPLLLLLLLLMLHVQQL